MQRAMEAIISTCLLGVLVASCGFGYGAEAPKSGAAIARSKRTAPVTDKTLVAWVRLANTTQRAGSALTLIDEAERFDAIVFAEVSPGKWMAGSDFFRRTERNQASYAAEQGPKAFVRMAIAYRGREVTIYRNAARYARYTIKAPQAFSPGCEALIGLRYIGSMGEIGPLAAAIDDARIYDRALTAEQIAALKPNRPSEPRPMAWWHFEDGSADDTMKVFAKGRLAGNARIADGKLILDGRNSYAICAWPGPPVKKVVQSMFYKARSRRTGTMWDTWLTLHDGTFYLYYLAKAGPRWNNISMATSPDGVHWTEVGRVLAMGPGVTWMGTGSTWTSPNFKTDRKFFMNFSEWKGPRQTIFFAESTDLRTWRRLGDELEFVQDERWYQPRGRWDCIWTIPRPGGGLYGYWTATPKPETGGRFGFGETLDGMRWKALAPPKVHGASGGEVGAIEKIGRKYYMMFGSRGLMMTLTADKPAGPFHAAGKNLRLLSGHTYFSRFFRAGGEVLVNHHAIPRNGQVVFAPLKAAVVDAEGTLRLAWWKGNEKMKHEPVAVTLSPVKPSAAKRGSPKPGDPNPRGPIMLANTFDTKAGVILEGTLALPEKRGMPRRGLYIECGSGRGAAVLINAAGQAELGPMRPDGTGFRAEKKVDREMAFSAPATFRLLLEGSLLEFYLDDILIECFSLPAAATGRIGLLTGGKSDAVGNLKAWR